VTLTLTHNIQTRHWSLRCTCVPKIKCVGKASEIWAQRGHTPTIVYLLLWPWPWSDDLDIRGWLRCCEEYIMKMYLHTKINYLGQGFLKLKHNTQTHSQTWLKTLPRHIKFWLTSRRWINRRCKTHSIHCAIIAYNCVAHVHNITVIKTDLYFCVL